MANRKQLEIIMRGAENWNSWRRKNRNANIDLSEAVLWEANLEEVNLRKANLNGANLESTNLFAADLRGADLRNTNLSRTFLYGADLSKANLSKTYISFANLGTANLSKANLRKTEILFSDLSYTNLTETDFREARFEEVNFSNSILKKTNLTLGHFVNINFGNNDLREVVGLETISHGLASTIGIDTIRKSKGKIPTEFLRGCGLSDLEIESAKLFALGLDHEEVSQITYEIHRLYLDQPIQFYSCFISYSNKDHGIAQQLHNDLQNNGVRCWFAPEDMKIGDRIRPTIDHQIRMREKLLVILSENSVYSEWVGDEVEAAIEQEKESGEPVLFPIRLDDAVLNARDDWAAMIKRRRHIGDFSTNYDKAFGRLLRDLKKE